MKKQIYLTGLFFLALTGFAQGQKYFTRNGEIIFRSDAPLEKIESSNKEVNIILDPAASTIAFKVVMKSFAFEKQGMKDHFNMDYLHTDTYPHATFEGTLSGIKDWSKNGTYPVTAEGKLTMHGVTKPVKHNGQVVISNGQIKLSSDFSVLLKDYSIKVPSNYISKISNTIQVSVSGTLAPYQR